MSHAIRGALIRFALSAAIASAGLWAALPASGAGSGLRATVVLATNQVFGHAPTGALVLLESSNDSGFAQQQWLTPFLQDGAYAFAGGIVWGANVRITLTQGATHVTTTVPLIGAVLDASADTLRGSIHGTNSPITLTLAATTTQYSVVPGTNGVFTAALGADIAPRDVGHLELAPPGAFRFTMRVMAPLVRVPLRGQGFSGYAPRVQPAAGPGFAVMIETYSRGLHVFNSGQDRYGPDAPSLDPDLLNAGGPSNETASDFALDVGDPVTITFGGQLLSRFEVPDFSVAPDVAAQAVGGRAPAGARVELWRFSGPLGAPDDFDEVFRSAPAQIAVVTSTGRYTAPMTLAHGDYGLALLTVDGGQQVFRRFATPHVNIWLGEPPPSGAVDVRGTPDVPISVAVASARGVPRGNFALSGTPAGFYAMRPTSIYQGWPLNYQPFEHLGVPALDVRVGSNDRVEIAGDGITRTAVVPTLTARTTDDGAWLHGIATPQAPITVALGSREVVCDQSGCNRRTAMRTTGADASGAYTVSLSGVFPDGDYALDGAVSMAIDAGIRVSTLFERNFPCSTPILQAEIGGMGAQIGFQPHPTCVPTRVVLRDGAGVLKAVLPIATGGQAWRDASGRTTLAQPGDHIDIALHDRLISAVVPSLTVSLVAGSDVITAHARPQNTIAATIRREGDEAVFGMRTGWPVGDDARFFFAGVADAQGSVVMTANTRLEHGDVLEFVVRDEHGLEFVKTTALPATRIWLGTQEARVRASAGGFLSLTVNGALTTVTSIALTADGVARMPRIHPAAALQIGDHLALTGALSRTWQVPGVTLEVDPQSRTISGTAPAGHTVRGVAYGVSTLYGFRAIRPQLLRETLTVGASGTYRFVVPGTIALLQVFALVTSPEGDSVLLQSGSEEHLEVELGSNRAFVLPRHDGIPFTATLRSPQGDMLGVVVASTSMRLPVSVYFPKPIPPGGSITLEQKGTRTLALPMLHVTFDAASRLLHAQLPPGTRAWLVEQPDYAVPTSRLAIADADGRMTLDLSDYPGGGSAPLWMVHETTGGHLIMQRFRPWRHAQVFPLILGRAAAPVSR